MNLVELSAGMERDGGAVGMGSDGGGELRLAIAGGC